MCVDVALSCVELCFVLFRVDCVCLCLFVLCVFVCVCVVCCVGLCCCVCYFVVFVFVLLRSVMFCCVWFLLSACCGVYYDW